MSGVIVIIPAAGSGSRFGGDIPKQFRTLGGKPLLMHVIERFLVDDRVERVIVPVQEMLLSTIVPVPGDRLRFIAGGATRQESVTRGFEAAAADEDEIVAVHDAVRPFFSYEVFHAVVDAALEHGAAFPAIDVADTIHVVEDNRIVGAVFGHACDNGRGQIAMYIDKGQTATRDHVLVNQIE